MLGSPAFQVLLAGPWVKNSLWTAARAVPSLDLRFADNKSLVDATTGASLVTFTRASSGTFVGNDGLIKTATTNEPRFDHNPTTGESLGLLVEEARTNLSLRSENFSSSYWVKTSCTITPDESTAPDGTLTADLWTNTASPGTIENSITKDATVRTYTASLWVKGTTTQFTVTLDDGNTVNRGRVQFNLSTNTVSGVFTDGLVFTGTSGTLTRFSDSWVRLTVTTTTSTGTTIRLRPFFSTTSATVRIWGAQVEEGAFATSYISTTSATVTRAADVASITGSNFSSWYNQIEGTMFADYVYSGSGNSVWLIDDTTANNFSQVFATSSINARASNNFYWAGLSSGRLDSGGVFTINSRTTSAVATCAGDRAFSANGLTASVAIAPVVMPTMSRLLLSGSSVLASNAGQTIRRLTYWPVRLADTTLQQITQP